MTAVLMVAVTGLPAYVSKKGHWGGGYKVATANIPLEVCNGMHQVFRRD